MVEPFHVPEAIVPRGLTLPDASRLTDRSAGYVRKTEEAPDSVIGEVLPLEFDSTVVRANVGPVVEYVPMPTSHALLLTMV
jgi:hypothetical protein